MQTRRPLLVAVFSCAGLAASAAASTTPTAVFSNIATSPNSDVPGLSGVKFNPGATSQFDRPFTSPNNQFWVFRAATELGASENEVIIVGSGITGQEAIVLLREGEPAFFDGMVNYGTIGTEMSINDAGAVAFSGDTTGPTTADAFIARYVPGSGFSLIALEGTQAVGQAPGVGYGSLTNAPRILNDAANTVVFRSSSLTGATTQAAIFRNTAIDAGEVVAQTDVTIPAGQLVAPDQTIDFITSNRLVVDAAGTTIVYHGDLNGPTATDLFVARNNTILGQEGTIISPEFAAPVLGFHVDAGSQQISPSGRLIFRGNNTDAQDWVIDGAGRILAATDRPITLRAGETEFYDDAPYASTFFLNVINDAGDRVIGGTTNAPDDAANAVLVFNAHRVVVREGDPVDVDADGLTDDDAFISIFNNDDAFLTADGWLFFNADLRNSLGSTIGQAFLRVHICKADWNVSGGTDSADISAFLSDWLASLSGEHLLADYNNDGATNSADISAFLAGWLDAVTGGC